MKEKEQKGTERIDDKNIAITSLKRYGLRGGEIERNNEVIDSVIRLQTLD